MSIARPSRGILNFKIIPVDCTKCEYYGDLTDLPDEAKRALIDSTFFHQLEEERLGLIQMRELFDRHPDSRHEMIVTYTGSLFREKVAPEPDPEFEKDLAYSHVKKFIGTSFFSIEARERFTSYNKKSELLISQEHNISCDKCGSLFVVPKSFCSMVGSYEDNIGLERSHRWQKNLMRFDGEGKLIAS